MASASSSKQSKRKQPEESIEEKLDRLQEGTQHTKNVLDQIYSAEAKTGKTTQESLTILKQLTIKIEKLETSVKDIAHNRNASAGGLTEDEKVCTIIQK